MELRQQPLLSRLHQFPPPNSLDLTKLVEYPPYMKPVPVKPYFFDSAYNYVGLEEGHVEKPSPALPKVEENKEGPVKRGWFWR